MKLNERSLALWSTSSSPVDKEGHLIKRGEMNRHFQRRWFVLKGNLLFYFAGQAVREPVGVIILEEHSVAMSDSRETKFAFDITFTAPAARVYTLAADSEALAMSWMRAIAHASFEYLRLMVLELQKKVDDLTEARRDTLALGAAERGSVSSNASRDSRRGLAANTRTSGQRDPTKRSFTTSGIPGANLLNPHRTGVATLAEPGGDVHQRGATSAVSSNALAVGHTTSSSLLDDDFEDSVKSERSKNPPPIPVPYKHRHATHDPEQDRPVAARRSSRAPIEEVDGAVAVPTSASAASENASAAHVLLARGASSDMNPVLLPISTGSSDDAASSLPRSTSNHAPIPKQHSDAVLSTEVGSKDDFLAGAIAAALASTEEGDSPCMVKAETVSVTTEAAVEPSAEELLKQLSFQSMHRQSFLGGSPLTNPRQQHDLEDSDDLF